jgi:hypothetical protein
MLLRRLFRHEQENHQRYWLTVGCIKLNRCCHPDECRNRLFESLDAAVRNRNALTQAGRSKPFARKQAVEYFRMGNALIIFKQQSGLLECAFLARGGQVDQYVGGRQNARN